MESRMCATSVPTRKARTSVHKNSPSTREDEVSSSQFLSLSRLPQVQARVKLSRSAIYSLAKQRKFPAPITLGRSAAWVDSEIDDWIRSRMASRGGA
jgi:prophage regulatory protein